MTPTKEQTEIVEAAKATKANLRLIAYAGAAKTTTLEMIAQAVPNTPTLYLVFNKKNAEEAQKRLPGHVLPMTLNSCGHRAWGAAQGKKLNLNTKKTDEYLNRAIEALPKRLRWDYFAIKGDLKKMIERAKVVGYIPEGKFSGAKPLVTRKEFEETFDDPVESEVLSLVDQALTAIITASYNGEVDFNDQLYMPTLFGGSFSRFPLVLVDESQDLSPINHAMLRKLGTERVIVVGDPYQSIYGFRGAVHSGMDRIAETFSTEDMKLSTSFRCPKAVVRKAWFRVPDMRWADWATEGEIHEPDSWDASLIPDGAAIICRHNAPLLNLGFKLIREGRGCSILGFDIGPGLLKTFKKFGAESMPRASLLDAIDRWEETQLASTRVKASVSDRAECFRIFASQGEDLQRALIWAEAIFKSTGSIQLMSGHKSKGGEWPVVFHLDPGRCKPRANQSREEQEQEMNVEYVITTRAKEQLWLVDMERYSA